MAQNALYLDGKNRAVPSLPAGRQACTVTLRCAQVFMFIAYNLRRIISILGKNQLMKYLGILVSLIFTAIVCFRLKLSHLEAMVLQKIICPWQIQLSLKSL
jgi:hypothetical protein